ncbi:TPA: hypothetical protein HA361_00465 [Candidatus Woesearchaeota archaeon]|nr:hypothetical protein [Candidatus Woesearchaeota archaeon]HII68779.1 hypothetical protein [Candidatus Woesearchaeota archaeon]
MKTKALLLSTVVLLLMGQFPLPAHAADDGRGDDLAVFGMELEKLMYLCGGIMAAALCAITFLAYRRTQRTRLLSIVLAFALFAVKGFLIATELFMDELPHIDLITTLLDFAMLAAFFYGVMKK